MGWFSDVFKGRNLRLSKGGSSATRIIAKGSPREGKERIRDDTTGSGPPPREIPSSHRPVAAEPPAVRHFDASLPMNTPFIIVELQQGTREWLEWRHKGIGASDASTIMGENPFKSTAALLQEKRGPARDSFENEAMALGKRLEPEARRRYMAKTGRDVRPACLQSTRYDWLRGSLDGLATNHNAVVEIKCGASVYRRASQSRSVPDYYYGQTQHILAVTGLDSLDFWCYWPGHPELLLPVERDDVYIERLLNKELQFWNHVQRNA